MLHENDVTKAIFERQSIREYVQRPLTDDEIETLAYAALKAPSARNLQPCIVRFITNKNMLDEINHDFKNYVGFETPAYSRFDTNPVYHNAPVMAMIFSKGQNGIDAGIMVENIALCAKGIGLDSVIVLSVGALFDSPDGKKWKEQLEVPEDFSFDIAVCIGEGNEKPPTKPRFEDRIKIIR